MWISLAVTRPTLPWGGYGVVARTNLLRELPEGMTATDVVVALPTSKGNIASRLNLTQEYFSRILNDLSRRGLLAVQGNRVLIPDVNKLQAYQGQATAFV